MTAVAVLRGPERADVPGWPVGDDAVLGAPLFSALTDQDATALRASMTEISLGRGHRLFREGDCGEQVYVVAAGKLKLGRTAWDGRENLLAVLGPGGLFGELSFFDPGPREVVLLDVDRLRRRGNLR